jgi:hypothetical protein
LRHRTTGLVVAAALVCLPHAWSAGPPAKPKREAELPPLNRKVVEYARGCLGEKVGDGQCTALASSALRAAGARRFPFGGTGGDYVWGREVVSFREALPGDLLQFRDAVFRGKTWVARTRWVSWRQTYPHHTAVVSEVRDRGKVVVILHQNVGPDGATAGEKQVVTETTLRTDSLQKGGHVWIYRPVDEDGAAFGADEDLPFP